MVVGVLYKLAGHMQPKGWRPMF